MRWLLDNPEIVLAALLRHAAMTGTALAIALALALPAGVWLARRPRAAAGVMAVLGAAYTIPSLALLILLVPVFGINARTVTAALVVYMEAILVRNVVAGLAGVDRGVLEAARAIGMTDRERLVRVELPLAAPVVVAGVRLAAVTGIGIATIGAKFNAGGLGTLLFEGIAQAGRADKIWAGAIAVSALALATDAALRWIERTLALTSSRARRQGVRS